MTAHDSSDPAALAAEAQRLLDAHGLTADAGDDWVTSGPIAQARVIIALAARVTAAEAAHAALAGAVRAVGDLIAEHGCSCDCDCTHTTGEHTGACNPCLACRASDVVSPILRGAPGGFVRASVVVEYVRAIDAYEAAGAAFAGRPSAATRAMECEAAADLATKRTALDAALAAVKETR